MKCVRGYEVRPYKSGAGWYLGTHDEEGFPQCRISSEYAKTEEEAWNLLIDRCNASENQFCSGGFCFGLTHIVHKDNSSLYESVMREAYFPRKEN